MNDPPLIYTSTLSHRQSAHCVYELPACHTIIWARTQKLILITTEVLPENSKRSMTFTVARITEYFKNASYADLNIVGGPLFCPVRKSFPKQLNNLLDLNKATAPMGCLTQLCRLTFCQRRFVVMGNYAWTKLEVWKSIMIFCNSVQHYFCQLYPEMQLTHIKSELIGDLTCQTLKLKLRN